MGYGWSPYKTNAEFLNAWPFYGVKGWLFKREAGWNTVKFYNPEDPTEHDIIYQDTIIVSVTEDGRFYDIDTGGHHTKTTRRKIEEYTPAGVYLYTFNNKSVLGAFGKCYDMGDSVRIDMRERVVVAAGSAYPTPPMQRHVWDNMTKEEKAMRRVFFAAKRQCIEQGVEMRPSWENIADAPYLLRRLIEAPESVRPAYTADERAAAWAQFLSAQATAPARFLHHAGRIMRYMGYPTGDEL